LFHSWSDGLVWVHRFIPKPWTGIAYIHSFRSSSMKDELCLLCAKLFGVHHVHCFTSRVSSWDFPKLNLRIFCRG
jgi:hypothetical protein